VPILSTVATVAAVVAVNGFSVDSQITDGQNVNRRTENVDFI
jgi:hypothetical protein